MICIPCRDDDHASCPERARQLDPDLSATDKIGSHLCYCAHRSRPGTVVKTPTRREDDNDENGSHDQRAAAA